MANPGRKRLTRRTILLLVLVASVLGGLLWDGSPLGAFILRQAVRLKFSSVREVSPVELVSWMRDPNRPPPLLIDARPAEQVAVSRIQGSVPMDPAAPDLGPLQHVARDQPLVVYDGPGVVSAAMATALMEAGFTRVSSLDGGLFRWANEGLPLVDDQGAASRVHPIDWRWGRLLKSRLHS